MVIVQLASEGF